MNVPSTCLIVVCAALLVSCVSEDGASAVKKAPSLATTKLLSDEPEKINDEVIPYPFDSCAVIQRPFNREGPKHRRIYDNHEVLFCCTPCVRAFDTNPEPYMPRIKEAAAERMAELNPAAIPQDPSMLSATSE